jgi:catechol 2,3-dioxygenase-like lactoylglutathione lyase family enzyme
MPSSPRPRPISLLQITLIVHDLAKTIRGFEDRLGLEVAFRDPGVAEWGLENAVLPLGTTFIELLSPLPGKRTDETPGGRHLARQGGDGGYMVILQVDYLSEWREPLAASKTRIAWEGETTGTLHGSDWAGFHLHPQDTGGMMISLDRPDPPDSWAGAGPRWRDFVRQEVVDGLSAIELESPDPVRLAARWSSVLGRPLVDGSDSSCGRLPLDRGEIRFSKSPSRTGRAAFEGLASVSLHASDRGRAGERFVHGGVTFQLV